MLTGSDPLFKVYGRERRDTPLGRDLLRLIPPEVGAAAQQVLDRGGSASAAAAAACSAAADPAVSWELLEHLPHSAGLEALQEYLSSPALAALLTDWLKSPALQLRCYSTSLIEALAYAAVVLHHPLLEQERKAIAGPHGALAQIRAGSGTRGRARITIGCGLHPWYCYAGTDAEELPSLYALHAYLMAAAPEICGGWGEMGLDRKRGMEHMQQMELLGEELKAAWQLDPLAPYSFHCVGMVNELHRVVAASEQYRHAREAGRRAGSDLPLLWGHVHGFNSNTEVARQLRRLGLGTGLGHTLLNPLNEKRFSKMLVESDPADLLIETDWASATYPHELLPQLRSRLRGFASSRTP